MNCKYCLSKTDSCTDIEAENCVNVSLDILALHPTKKMKMKINLTNRDIKLLKDELDCIISCIEGSRAVLPLTPVDVACLLDPIMNLVVNLHDSITRQTMNTINEINL